MLNENRKNKEKAMKKFEIDFANKYRDIKKSDISEEEKRERISKLIEENEEMRNLLQNAVTSEDLEELGFKITENKREVDENIINALVGEYSKQARLSVGSEYVASENQFIEHYNAEDDILNFEEKLRNYFTEHYDDLFDTGYNSFLSDISSEASEVLHEKDGDLIKIAKDCNINYTKLKYFGGEFTIQDGLVSKEESTLGRVEEIIYATKEGINKRLEEIYSGIVYKETFNKDSFNFFKDELRKLKNSYLSYAKEKDYTIDNEDIFEKIPVDSKKVEDIAKYINKTLKNEGILGEKDYTDRFKEEITDRYSEIMNLHMYHLDNLDSVKELLGDKHYFDELSITIEDDSIVSNSHFYPGILYGTPEYVKEKYDEIMKKVHDFHSTNAFVERNYYDSERVNSMKNSLRDYIRENNIEGIDISVKDVPVNHDIVNAVADTMIELYGECYGDKASMKEKLVNKLNDNYSELLTERQNVCVDRLFKEEVKEMGAKCSIDRLQISKDFAFIGNDYNNKCAYATQESLQRNIRSLDEKIISKEFCFEEERTRTKLLEYAKENKIDIDVPDISIVKERKNRKEEMFSFNPFNSNNLPDDPTAREKLELNDTIFSMAFKMSEGNPGAITAIANLLKEPESGFMTLLSLDDMNIRGSQIWVAYKNLYKENPKRFAKALTHRSSEIVEYINQELAQVGGEKAVESGASFDRSKNPNKYRFTEEEVEKLKADREKRIEKQRESFKKMLENSPSKKIRGKERLEREERKRAYREKLKANGKKSLKELDNELSELEEKEKQAKELYNQYQEQLPNKDNQIIGG